MAAPAWTRDKMTRTAVFWMRVSSRQVEMWQPWLAQCVDTCGGRLREGDNLGGDKIIRNGSWLTSTNSRDKLQQTRLPLESIESAWLLRKSLMGMKTHADTACSRWPSLREQSSAFSSTSSMPNKKLLSLDSLFDPNRKKMGKRLGRGIGSGKGKTSGRGHKGQKSRSGSGAMLGFEGGQTPLALRTAKRGFSRSTKKFNLTNYTPLNIDTLQTWVNQGKLDPTRVITMKDLRESGAISRQLTRIGNGVKLLSRGKESLGDRPIHIQVLQCSKAARNAIEEKGGSVKTVYYNKLGLRALLKVSDRNVSTPGTSKNGTDNSTLCTLSCTSLVLVLKTIAFSYNHCPQ